MNEISINQSAYLNDARSSFANFPVGPVSKPKVLLGAPISSRSSFAATRNNEKSFEKNLSVVSKDAATVNNDKILMKALVEPTRFDKNDLYMANSTPAFQTKSNHNYRKIVEDDDRLSPEDCDAFNSDDELQSFANKAPGAETLLQTFSDEVSIHRNAGNVNQDDSNFDDRSLSPWSRDMANYSRSLSQLDINLEELRLKIRSLSKEDKQQFLKANRHLLNSNDPELIEIINEGEPETGENIHSQHLTQKTNVSMKTKYHTSSNNYSSRQANIPSSDNGFRTFLPQSNYGAKPKKPQGLLGPQCTMKNNTNAATIDQKFTIPGYLDVPEKAKYGQRLQQSAYSKFAAQPAELREGEPDLVVNQIEDKQSNSGNQMLVGNSFNPPLLSNFRNPTNSVFRPVAISAKLAPVGDLKLINRLDSDTTLETDNKSRDKTNKKAMVSSNERLNNIQNSLGSSQHSEAVSAILKSSEFKKVDRSKYVPTVSQQPMISRYIPTNDIQQGIPYANTLSSDVYKSQTVKRNTNTMQSSRDASFSLGNSVPNLSVATATNLLLHPKPSAYNQSVSFSQQELYDSNYTMHTQPSSVVVHRQGSDRTKGPRPTSQPVMSENYLLSSQEDLVSSRGGVRMSHKSNRHIIVNAISFSCLAGPANERVKIDVLQEIAKSTASNFVVLFRDTKLQFRSLYTFSSENAELIKLYGIGPKQINNNMIEHFYKYDSGAKEFVEIKTTKHVSVIVDGIVLQSHYWKSKLSTQRK